MVGALAGRRGRPHGLGTILVQISPGVPALLRQCSTRQRSSPASVARDLALTLRSARSVFNVPQALRSRTAIGPGSDFLASESSEWFCDTDGRGASSSCRGGANRFRRAVEREQQPRKREGEELQRRQQVDQGAEMVILTVWMALPFASSMWKVRCPIWITSPARGMRPSFASSSPATVS